MRFWVVVLAVTVVACAREYPADPPSASDYLPLKAGAWFIYAVDSVVINQNVSTPYHYDLRVDVTNSFEDATGELNWVLQRSKRSDSTKAWMSAATWSARVTTYQAVVNEGNISFVKLTGPVGEGISWNGNTYNNLEGVERCPGSTANTCDLYTFSNVGKPAAAGNLRFAESALVIQSADNDSIVARDLRSELYARHTGLIVRQITQLQYCGLDNCIGQQIIDKGLDYRQTITSYGGF